MLVILFIFFVKDRLNFFPTKKTNTNPASYTENGGTIEGKSETDEAENKRAFEVAEYER